MHRAVNDHGTQRSSGLDAENPEIAQAAAGAAVLFVDRQAEHARVGQRLPLRGWFELRGEQATTHCSQIAFVLIHNQSQAVTARTTASGARAGR